MGCIFCDVLSGRAPCSILFDDGVTAAFLDLFPVNPGHALVVPKRHVEDLVACPSETSAQLFGVAQRLAPVLVRATGAQGFNVWTANGRAAGQEVFHLHLHVLPRFEEDAFGLRFPKDYPREASRASLDVLAQSVRSLL